MSQLRLGLFRRAGRWLYFHARSGAWCV